MWSRLIVPVLGLFWAVMCLLLWRSEYGRTDFSGTPIPPQLVWQKILTSPDSSSLAILLHGKRIGFCHLITSVGAQLDGFSGTKAPEGLVRSISGYNLDLSGTAEVPGEGNGIRFDGQLVLDQAQHWDNFDLHIQSRPVLSVKLNSSRTNGLLHVSAETPEGLIERTLQLSQLRNPETLLAELFGPAGQFMLGVLPFPMPDTKAPELERTIEWAAATDRVRLGQSTANIYRLELKPINGYSVIVLVSRAGEILRLELPGDVQLINESLIRL